MIVLDDIYMAAYLQVEGFTISDIKVSPNRGGQKVEFSLCGNRESELKDKFNSGRATVNIKDYLFRLFELRNVMYSMKNNRRTNGERNEHNSRRTKTEV